MAVNEILAALADENRRKILHKLKEGKISSGDLANALVICLARSLCSVKSTVCLPSNIL